MNAREREREWVGGVFEGKGFADAQVYTRGAGEGETREDAQKRDVGERDMCISRCSAAPVRGWRMTVCVFRASGAVCVCGYAGGGCFVRECERRYARYGCAF